MTAEALTYVCSHVFDDPRPILLVSRAGREWQCLCGGDDHDVEGYISQVKLRCEKHDVYFAFDPNLQYQVASQDGDCWMELVGGPGLYFCSRPSRRRRNRLRKSNSRFPCMQATRRRPC
jgi:hypothetical protein